MGLSWKKCSRKGLEKYIRHAKPSRQILLTLAARMVYKDIPDILTIAEILTNQIEGAKGISIPSAAHMVNMEREGATQYGKAITGHNDGVDPTTHCLLSVYWISDNRTNLGADDSIYSPTYSILLPGGSLLPNRHVNRTDVADEHAASCISGNTLRRNATTNRGAGWPAGILLCSCTHRGRPR
jgi:hypothetical protein